MPLSSLPFRKMKSLTTVLNPQIISTPPTSSPPAPAPNPLSSAVTPSPSNDDQIYDIEQILKYHTRKGEKQCFVKWKGFGSQHNSWIPMDSLTEKPDPETHAPHLPVPRTVTPNQSYFLCLPFPNFLISYSKPPPISFTYDIIIHYFSCLVHHLTVRPSF